MTLGWSQERTEKCARLWMEGKSASQVAKCLGGITRNSVISKVHRMGLKRSEATTRHNRASHRSKNGFNGGPPRLRKRRVKFAQTAEKFLEAAFAEPALHVKQEPVVPVIAHEEPEQGHVELVDLQPSSCKWPYGDGPFTFCGEPKTYGRPYCKKHTGLAFAGLPGKRKP